MPQHFVKHGYIGDPSQLLIPAAEQFRKDYVFLVPGTFQTNYIVFAKPIDANDRSSTARRCDRSNRAARPAPIGTVDERRLYDQVTCTAPPRVTTSVSRGPAVRPLGVRLLQRRSYAFVGGSDVKIINPIE